MYYLFGDSAGDCGDSFESAHQTLEEILERDICEGVVYEPRDNQIWVVAVRIHWCGAIETDGNGRNRRGAGLYEWLLVDMSLEDYAKKGEFRYISVAQRNELVKDGRLII